MVPKMSLIKILTAFRKRQRLLYLIFALVGRINRLQNGQKKGK